MQTYRTAQVAKMIGIHPNTVRLYEELGLVPRARRLAQKDRPHGQDRGGGRF